MLAGLWLTAVLTVILEGNAMDASSLSAAVASCDEVLSEHHCVAADATGVSQSGGTDDEVAFYAELGADAALARVHLEVHRGGKDGALSLSRDLLLDASASREERARALGLVVAAHVVDEQRRLAAAAPEPETGSAARRDVRRGTRRYSLDVAPFVGSALDTGPLRVGLMLRGSLLSRSGRFGALVSARGAYRFALPRLWWAGATLGMFVRQQLRRAPLAFEQRLEAVAQRTEARAKQNGELERTNTVRVGGQLGVEMLLRVAEASWLLAGAEAALLRPRVDVTLRGRDVGTEPLYAWSLLLGARTSW